MLSIRELFKLIPNSSLSINDCCRLLKIAHNANWLNILWLCFCNLIFFC